MSDVCKTCGIVAGTHACNPLDINMKNMRLTIQNQQAEITRLNEVVKMYEIDAKRYRWLKCEGKEIVICRWNKSGCTEMFVDAIDKNIDQAMSEKGDK